MSVAAISGARFSPSDLSSSIFELNGLIISRDRWNLPSGSLITRNPFLRAENYKWLCSGRLKCHIVEGWHQPAIIAQRLLFLQRRRRKTLRRCHYCREALSLIQQKEFAQVSAATSHLICLLIYFKDVAHKSQIHWVFFWMVYIHSPIVYCMELQSPWTMAKSVRKHVT